MNPDTKKVVLELAAKQDGASYAFALNALAGEPVDAAWHDTAAAVAAKFGALRATVVEASPDTLRSALERFAVHAGVVPYLGWAADADWKDPHLSMWVASVPMQTVLADAQSVAPTLDALFASPMAGAGVVAWCSGLVDGLGESTPTAVAMPLLRAVGKASPDDVDFMIGGDDARRLVGRPELTARVRDHVLDAHADEDDVLIGLFRLLAVTGDVEHVERVGPFVEDAGAWMRISRAVLTADRLDALWAAFDTTGLRPTVALHRIRPLEGAEFARRLAADPRFHAGIARLVGARSTLFALGRLFTDKTVLASLRYLVGDHDAPVRLAAVGAVAQLGGPAALPFLETGLMDRNRGVRTAAQAALREAVGDEAYAATVERLQQDVGRVRDELKESTTWAQQAQGKIQGVFSDALEATKQAPGAIRNVAARVFDRKARG